MIFNSTGPMHISKEPLQYNWDYHLGSRKIATCDLSIPRVSGSSLNERKMFNRNYIKPQDIFDYWPEHEIHTWLDENVSDLFVEMEFTYVLERDSMICELQVRGTVPSELLDYYRELLIMFKLTQ